MGGSKPGSPFECRAELDEVRAPVLVRRHLVRDDDFLQCRKLRSLGFHGRLEMLTARGRLFGRLHCTGCVRRFRGADFFAEAARLVLQRLHP